MKISETSVVDFVSRVMLKIDKELTAWHEDDRSPIRDAIIEGLEAAYAESARLAQVAEAPAVAEDDDEEWQKRIMSEEEAERLADELFGLAGIMPYSKEADDLAAVAIKIINMFGDERNYFVTKSNANFLTLAIYKRTEHCCRQMDKFTARAQLRGVTQS